MTKKSKRLVAIYAEGTWKHSDYAEEISNFEDGFEIYAENDLNDLFESAGIDLDSDSLWAIQIEKDGRELVIIGDAELTCSSVRVAIFDRNF